jgi:hypothetical protein
MDVNEEKLKELLIMVWQNGWSNRGHWEANNWNGEWATEEDCNEYLKGFVDGIPLERVAAELVKVR